MSQPTISLVLTTIGRPTLQRSLESLCRQEWIEGDELLLVDDSGISLASASAVGLSLPCRYIPTPALGSWGHAARNDVLDSRLPTANVVYSLDDDDTLEPCAFASIRRAAATAPGRPLLFRMRCSLDGNGATALRWERREVMRCNIGTGMFCFPNDGNWGRFGLTHEGDCEFIRDTILRHGGEPVWCDDVIYNMLGSDVRVKPDDVGTTTFLHSGQVGDLIYGLPAIKALGGGILYLAPGNHKDAKFSLEMAEKTGTLLRSQPYIRDVRIWNRKDAIRHNLDAFRTAGNPFQENLTDLHLRAVGMGVEHKESAWLTVPPVTTPGKDVVFQRTPRRRNPNFSWKKIYQEYRDRAVLVGIREEQALFEREVGPIDCFRPHDFLEMASLIRGSSVFVGNSSCGAAMAEGMKHPNMIVEVYQKNPTGIFARDGARYCARYPQ